RQPRAATFVRHAHCLVSGRARTRGERVLLVQSVLGPVSDVGSGLSSHRLLDCRATRDILDRARRRGRLLHEARGDGCVGLFRSQRVVDRTVVQYHPVRQRAARVGCARLPAFVYVRSSAAARRRHLVPHRVHRGPRRNVERHVLDPLRPAAGELLSRGPDSVYRTFCDPARTVHRLRSDLSRVRAPCIPVAHTRPIELGVRELPRLLGGYDRTQLSSAGLRRERRRDLARRTQRVVRSRQYGRDVLRHLSVHQVLRLVVGDHAEVRLLLDHRADCDSVHPGHETHARRDAKRSGEHEVNVRWSNKPALLVGIALIVVTNAIALGGVAYNRASTPESVLALTERELPIVNWSWPDNDNSSIDLTIDWRVRQTYEPGAIYGTWQTDWLSEEQLRALGFDTSLLDDSELALERSRRQLPKRVFLVLEYDGAAYREALEQRRDHVERAMELMGRNVGDATFEARLKAAREALEHEEQSASRLFVVDAGLDPTVLRERYSDRTRYAIVRGRVGIYVSGEPGRRRVAAASPELDIGQ